MIQRVKIIIVALAMGSGASADISTSNRVAKARIVNSAGAEIGRAKVSAMRDGVKINLKVSNLKPGTLALHIHEHGACEGPSFESAGSHFNPMGKAHGFQATNGPHLGDLRNIEVNEQGKATVEQKVSGLTLDPGQVSIVGKTLVIHAGPDDYKSQPAGGSGDRIACGVIQQSVDKR